MTSRQIVGQALPLAIAFSRQAERLPYNFLPNDIAAERSEPP